MPEDKNKKIIAGVIAALAIILIAGGFYYSYRMKANKPEVFNPSVESSRGEDETIQTVDVKHQYKGGVHTFAGEINLPTPCDSVEVNATKSGSPEKIALAFTSSNTADVCTQVVSARRFKTTIEAAKDAEVSGTLNGKEIKVNVFEVPAGENLDTFEINVKG